MEEAGSRVYLKVETGAHVTTDNRDTTFTTGESRAGERTRSAAPQPPSTKPRPQGTRDHTGPRQLQASSMI